MSYGSASALLKQEIEARLAARIPGALSPVPRQAPRLLPTGVPAVDRLLGGGLPLGGISEVAGTASSGRTALALSFLAKATHEAACAYIDAGDCLDPVSTAAGIRMENLLLVRLRSQIATLPSVYALRSQLLEEDGWPFQAASALISCGTARQAGRYARTPESGFLFSFSTARACRFRAFVRGGGRLRVRPQPGATLQCSCLLPSRLGLPAPSSRVAYSIKLSGPRIRFCNMERFTPRAETAAGPANSYGGRELAVSLLLDRSGTEALLGQAREYAEKLMDSPMRYPHIDFAWPCRFAEVEVWHRVDTS